MLYYGLEWNSLTSYFQFKEMDEPDTPPANEIRQFAEDSGGTSTMCWKNDAGVKTCLPLGGGSLITGAGVAGRVAFWDSASSLSSDADLTFATDTLTATKIIAPTSITISALTATRILFAGAAGLISEDSTFTFSRDDAGFASIITLGDDSHTAVINGPAGVTINIDSNNNDTGALFAIQSNTALRLTGGTRLLTITETGAATFVTTVSAGTGFQIAGGATLNNILLGNGTNFVSSAQSGIDHGSIGGLSDDDHSGYALLLGRSGGQILIGGTASGDDLTLKSTSNATKGSIFLGTASAYDEVNDRLGIGITAPLQPFHLFRNGSVPVLHVVGEWDQAFMNAQIDLRSYSGSNVNAGGVFRGMGIRGTFATPSATASGDVLAQFVGDGYTNALTVNGQAALIMKAGSLWSATNAETFITLGVTLKNATSVTNIVLFGDSSATIPALAHITPTIAANDTTYAGFDNQVIFAPTDSVATRFGGIERATFSPASTKTITTAFGHLVQSNTGSSGGALTTLYNGYDQVIYGTTKPTTVYGRFIDNVGSAGITTVVGLHIAAQSGGTNNFVFELPADATDPTGGGGAATGRVPCLIGGALRYIAYY